MQTDIPLTVAPRPLPPWLRFFRPAPPKPVTLTDPAELQRSLQAWQTRVLIASTIGYAIFYFVRKNLSVAMPVMEKQLGIGKESLGLFLTLHGVIYGVSKFTNGFFGDRCNARAFMVVGLAGSAVMNLFFGFSSAVVTFGVFWMINGWFQGMGFPPCARLLAHWFPPKTFAMKMSVWNISHSAGAGLILVLCGFVLAPIGWRMCFLVPAAIALVCAVALWLTLPDTPPSVGLPEVEGTHTSHPEGEPVPDFFQTLMKYVFTNKYIWLISIANFFVYTLRYAVLDWGPTLLSEAKHLSIGNSALIVAGFELAGVPGALVSGWLTDRVFGGRAMRVGVFYMMLAGVFIYLFWKFAGESKLWNRIALRRGLFHLRPAMPDRCRGREARHQTRRRHGGGTHRAVRLPQHDLVRLRPRLARQTSRVGRRFHRAPHRRRDRHHPLRGLLAREGRRLRPRAQRAFARFFASSLTSAFSGSVLITSAFVSQPLRAMPAPRRRKPACSARCASQLITHFTPLDLA